MSRLLGWVVAVFVLLSPSAAAWAKTIPLHVLVISSFVRDIPAQTALERGMQHSLPFQDGSNDVVFEFMDASRAPPTQVAPALAALIRAKYQDVTWDAVVAWGPVAGQFVINNADLFGDAPRLHLETTPAQLQAMHAGPRDQAVTFPSDYQTSIATAVDVSGAETLIVIGTQADAPGRRRLESFRTGLKALDRPPSVEYLLDLPLPQLETLLAKLPGNAAVYYLLMFSDGLDTRMTPYAVAQRLAAASSAPIFSQWESLMGSGIVGGHVFSHEAIGDILGQTLAALPERSTITKPFMRSVYDWHALDHWQLNRDRLAKDAVFVNQPHSLWHQYGWYVTGLTVVLLMLIGLSLALARALYAKRGALVALDSERRQLTDMVALRTQELTRSNRELESFAFAVSHDLRTPLRAIGGYSKLLSRKLERTSQDDETTEFLNFIIDGTQHMDAMILGLLEYSRVTEHLADKFTATDLARVIAESLQPLALEAQACGAAIVLDIASDLPGVQAERALLTRLFQNLLENALKYRAPERPLQVSVNARPAPGGVLVTVTDNGRGIPPDQHERVFGLFQRLNATNDQSGFGIGLALCQRIAKIHGGKLWIETPDAGLGCRFCLALPVSTQQQVNPDSKQ